MEEELDAEEEEEALALITAACLGKKIKDQTEWRRGFYTLRRTCGTWRHPPGLGQGLAIGLTVVV